MGGAGGLRRLGWLILSGVGRVIYTQAYCVVYTRERGAGAVHRLGGFNGGDKRSSQGPRNLCMYGSFFDARPFQR